MSAQKENPYRFAEFAFIAGGAFIGAILGNAFLGGVYGLVCMVAVFAAARLVRMFRGWVETTTRRVVVEELDARAVTAERESADS
jgi:hypothetical protein